MRLTILTSCAMRVKWQTCPSFVHDVSVVRRIANDPDHLRVIRITGDDDVASLSRCAFGEMLYASDEWTSGVDHFRRSPFEIVLHLRRDAVGTNHGNRVAVSFIRRIDGGDALGAKPFHFLRVVDQRAERANGPGALVDRFLDHLYSALDAETESVFVCQ